MPRVPNRSKQTLLVLQSLLEARMSWKHGYELSQLTRLKSGTLYPLLMRLSEQGLLEDRWEESDIAGRPPRHAYRLSSSGRAFAREALSETQAVTAPRRQLAKQS
jgi:PadR family transcriptional regulator, regulatory protein PadR